MKYLLKNILRPLSRHIKDKNEREFAKLHDKWAGYERFCKVDDVRFLDYIFDVPDLPSFVWQFKDIFVENSYKFAASTDVPVIIDCGANIGTSCLYFKQMYPKARVIAFEADPIIANYLENNLARNAVKDIRLIKKAVWVDECGVEFGSEGADGGAINSSQNKITVPSVRLKNFLESESNIDLLKIDIEGAEYDVLKDCGNSLGSVKNLFVEYHSWNNEQQKLSEILQTLEKNNFRYYVESISHRKTPFINKGNDQKMDLQLNIFGIKNVKETS